MDYSCDFTAVNRISRNGDGLGAMSGGRSYNRLTLHFLGDEEHHTEGGKGGFSGLKVSEVCFNYSVGDSSCEAWSKYLEDRALSSDIDVCFDVPSLCISTS